MITEQMKLLEITVAKGIQKLKDEGSIAGHVFISKAYPESQTILGLEVIQTHLLEPDKIIIVTKEFFEEENPWRYDFKIDLEGQ